MVLKKKTISLILTFFGVLTIIFGAFYIYILSKEKQSLIEKLAQVSRVLEEQQLKVDALEHFYRVYYKLMDPYFQKQYNNPEFLKQLISCVSLKANFTLDRTFYNLVKKTLRLHNKYKLADSCYFSFIGLKFPPSYIKVINKGAKFDITMEETEKRPSLIKLIMAYLEKIQTLEQEIESIDNTITTNSKKLEEFLPAGEDFTSIGQAFHTKENEIFSKLLKETEGEAELKKIEEELKKEGIDNRILKKYYVIKKKLYNYVADLSQLLDRVEQYLFGITKKEFSGEEILRGKDYSTLCSQLPTGMPASCVDLKTLFCEKKEGRLQLFKSFSWIVTELEWPKMVKINELKNVLNLKSRLDRNDTSILEEFKESQEPLPTYAKNILLLRQTKKILTDQIEKIRSKIARQKIEKKPVGTILSVDTRSNKGIINLGRKNGLFNNNIFEIYGTIKGREFVLKGIAKILKIGEDYSKILILPLVSVEDKSFVVSKGAGVAYPEFFDIITKEFTKRLPYRDIIKINQIKGLKVEPNDMLYSEIFDPSHKKIVSFAGNLHLIYTNSELSKKIEKWNFKYQEKADINNDYVILGKDYKDSENYKIAKELNIKLVREKDFYDFLELQYRY